MMGVNMRSLAAATTVGTIATLACLSFYHSYQQRLEIAASNELLAGFQRDVVKVNPSVYKHYVGLYQLEPDFNIAITSDGERLFAQGSNQIRVELYPASESTFFNNYTEALIVFEAPNQGETHQFVLHQINQIRHGRRI